MEETQRRRLVRVAMVTVAGTLTGGLLFALLALPDRVEARRNTRAIEPPYDVSPAAQKLHPRLLVADLHSDALMWNRDLTRRSDRGHVDLPRLQEGNIALQAFTVVTKTPKNRSDYERTSDGADQITKLAILQLWPPSTWRSLKQRALYQAAKVERFAELSEGSLVILRTEGDLTRFLDERQTQPKMTAAILGTEGAQVLEGDLANLQELFDAGFRMIGLTHHFDNEVGGSAHGVRRGGLTPFGRRVIQRMQELGMLIDLAHASPELIDDVMDIARGPVVVSHTGVRGTCDDRRNLADRHIDRIARTGGVIGIGLWKTALCGEGLEDFVRAVRHVIDRVEIEHVALGSDFDGAVRTLFDASGMALVTEALLDAGFLPADIRKIMGENVIRVLREVLPEDT